MTSFEKMIGANAESLRETRVKNTVRNAESASRQKVEAAKQEFRNMQAKFEDLVDLGATNTMDIATHLKGFNAEKFVSELYPLAVEMAIKAKEVAVVVNVHNMLFPKNTIEGLDEDDLSILNGIEKLL